MPPPIPPTKCAEENQFCGGIAGIGCCDRLACQLAGDFPDAGGKCVKKCSTDSDCPQIRCIRAPCPQYSCIGGKCLESTCGNSICEEGEDSHCPPCTNANPPCLAPCTKGTCPQDCQKEIEISVPSPFSLSEGQSARTTNYQDVKIKLESINDAQAAGGGGKQPPPPPVPSVKITVSSPNYCRPLGGDYCTSQSSEYTISQGSSVEGLGLKIAFNGLNYGDPAGFKLANLDASIVNVCTDSDGGKDYFVKGTVSANGQEATDFCYNYDQGYGPCEGKGGCVLAEHSCNKDGTSGKEKYDCPNGCKDGACLKSCSELSVEECLKYDYCQLADTISKPGGGGKQPPPPPIQKCADKPKPYIQVISPNGWGAFRVGETITVKWQTSNFPANSMVNIALRGGGYDVTPAYENMIAANVANTGSYDWVPQLAADDVYIVIYLLGQEGNGAYDASDAPFSIVQPPVCTDSDGGKNIFAKGVAESSLGLYYKITVTDYCLDKFNLNEALCDEDGSIFTYAYGCYSGCRNGACIKSPQEQTFRNAEWTCADGYAETQGEPTSCKTTDTWLAYAGKSCSERCNADGSRCGISYFSITTSCDSEDYIILDVKKG